MEHNILTTIERTFLAFNDNDPNSYDQDTFTVEEAERLKNCFHDRIGQLRTEICNLKSQIKSLEGNGLLRDDSDTDENVRVEKRKLDSFKSQENILASQVQCLISNINLLEDATLKLRSSIFEINAIKDDVRHCFSVKENSVPSLITPEFHNPNKKARLNLDNENTSNGCQNEVLNFVNRTVADPLKENFESKLSQDELELIFKQSFIITTKDLLNFRCVNSAWRDAATSILLIRDSCQLNLELKSIPAADNKQNIVYCRRHPFNVVPLTDLFPIIRASRKFPTTSLNIPGDSIVRSELIPNFHNQVELLQFFTLYGKFIKSITIGTLISRTELEDLLSHYTPNLECLKFKSLECISDKIQGNLFSQPTPPGVCSSLKVISTGPCSTIGIESKQCSANLKALLDVATHLESIENVRLELSRILVEEQKVHLVKELIFSPTKDDPQMIEMTNNLVAMNPKLSVLEVIFDIMAKDSYPPVISALNSLLESSKNTLECFKIAINLNNFPRKIRIPSLKNLKHIKFTENIKNYGMSFGNGMEDPIFEFPEATAGHELFPNLFKVELILVRKFRTDNALMGFFPYYLNNRGNGSSTKNYLPSVKVLEISFRKWQSLDNAPFTFPRLFPNIRHLTLKIDYNFGRDCVFRNSIWDMCPLAESIEIIVGRKHIDNHATEAVDSFFTGFPSDICSKLLWTDLALKYTKEKELIELLRVRPSICDLKCLKFLTVRFSKLTSHFISKVSGLYAFERMPQMKVTFTCDPSVGVKDRKKMQRCCSHLTDFVNVDIDTTSDGNTSDHESVTKKHSDGDVFTDSDSDFSLPSSYFGSDDSIDSLSD